MDTSRIVINTIDNSTSYVEQSTGVVGFTVVKAPKGSITPRKILAGGASKIKDIFGEATEEYPELFEVETFNKEYDIYVSAPYSSAKVPVAYLTDKGVFVKKDTVKYTDKLEKYILEGDTYENIEGISTFTEETDLTVYKKCDIEYKTIGDTTGILIDTKITGDNIDSNGNIITIKGLLKSLNSNFKLTKTSCSVVDASGENVSNSTVSVNIYEKDEKDSFKKVTENPSTIKGNVYLLITDASNIIESTYSIDSNFKELSSYMETTLDKDDIYATILPKYPSERKLHISFVPFNDLKGYSYKVLSQRNILKINAYEDNAFHNVYSPVYIEGTLDKKSTSSVSPFTNTNESLTNQELVAVIPIKPFTKESLSIEPKYDSIVLEGGERKLDVKESTKGAGDAITSVKLHNRGWETVKSEDLDDVDIFFDSEYHQDDKDLENSVFFKLGVNDSQNNKFYGPQNNRFSGHIFNYTPSNPNTITEKLSFGRNYWNICNLAVIDLSNGGRILSPMTGARALMQCRIIEGAYGGVAPMWENSKGMGGQLNMISPYRVKYKYTKEQLDNLDLYNYNPVIYDRQYGLMCVGQKTCKDGEITDWSYIGHACAFMVFIKQIRKYVMLPQIGKKNNPYYRTLRKEQVQQYLRDRISGTDRIWSEGIVDTSTADGVNDLNAQRARKFVIKVSVKVDTFSEYVELNFYNEDQSTTIGTDF